MKQIAWLDEPDTDGQLDRLIEAVRSWPQRRRTGAETKRYLGQVLALRLTAPVLQQVVTMEHYHHGTKLEKPLVTYVIHPRDKPKPTYTNWRPDVVSPLAYDCEQACWESIRRNAAHVRRLLRAQAPRQVELEIQGIRNEIHFLARIEERIHEIANLREEEDGWVANEDPDNDYHKYGSSLSGSVIRAIEHFMDVLEPEGDYSGHRVNDDDPDPPTGLLLAVRDPDLLRMCVRCLRSLHPFEAKHIARVMASDLSFDENCTGDNLARFQEALQQPVEHDEKFSPKTITRQGERNNVGMGPRRAP